MSSIIAGMAVILEGERVRLRQVGERDLPRLKAILAEPEVARWWIAFDDDELLGHETEEDAAMTAFVILVCEGDGDDAILGWISGWEKNDPEYRHAGIDLFLAGAAQGRGLGPEAIRLVCRWLFDEQRHHRIVIDPAATNVRAIKAYERVGFRRVGVMRQYERGDDGTYHDGVLLDLLREDLAP